MSISDKRVSCKVGVNMFKIDDNLKNSVSNLSKHLEQKYGNIIHKNKDELRLFIQDNIGQIISMEKLDKNILNDFQKHGGIVGVDGSNNKIGGAFPHYVEMYQAMAKCTGSNDDIIQADIYTPLMAEQSTNSLESIDKYNEDNRNIKLANLEVEVALKSIDEFKPYAIIMDGGLIRYNIYASDTWNKLRMRCEEENIRLVGVIKDIKTSIIGTTLLEKNSDYKDLFYDKEALFGVLKYGEMIQINDDVNKKEKEGYSSIFLRSSLAPTVIGMDIIDSQRMYLEEMGRLIFTLTPENSRGVPLWLDIVDKEVKISDDIMRGLLERYMDREIYERFFVSERDRRS